MCIYIYIHTTNTATNIPDSWCVLCGSVGRVLELVYLLVLHLPTEDEASAHIYLDSQDMTFSHVIPYEILQESPRNQTIRPITLAQTKQSLTGGVEKLWIID